jgi:3-methyladenine DNA glycosylase AlkD
MAAPQRAPSAVTVASNLFVAAHKDRAAALGDELGGLVGRPAAFVSALEAGLASVADPVVDEGIHRVTPGLGSVIGVRLPLLEAAHRRFERSTRNATADELFAVTERLIDHPQSEIRWFGMWNLERLLRLDSERAWQLMRRASHEAGEWITIDTLAHPYGAGVLLEPRRWWELQSLLHSPSRWERRLVGSTLATMPHVKRVPGNRDKSVATKGLALIGQLIGDDEPDVQKALSWALRTLAEIDPADVAAFIEREATAARNADDGHRAWVLRDSLNKLPEETAGRVRIVLAGIRRKPGAPSTSRAAIAAVEAVTAAAASRPGRSLREE